MEPDSIGKKDIMAVVVSKDSLNWSELNAKISQNRTTDYAARLRSALGSSTSLFRPKFLQKEIFISKGKPAKTRLVACIVEVNK